MVAHFRIWGCDLVHIDPGGLSGKLGPHHSVIWMWAQGYRNVHETLGPPITSEFKTKQTAHTALMTRMQKLIEGRFGANVKKITEIIDIHYKAIQFSTQLLLHETNKWPYSLIVSDVPSKFRAKNSLFNQNDVTIYCLGSWRRHWSTKCSFYGAHWGTIILWMNFPLTIEVMWPLTS